MTNSARAQHATLTLKGQIPAVPELYKIEVDLFRHIRAYWNEEDGVGGLDVGDLVGIDKTTWHYVGSVSTTDGVELMVIDGIGPVYAYTGVFVADRQINVVVPGVEPPPWEYHWVLHYEEGVEVARQGFGMPFP